MQIAFFIFAAIAIVSAIGIVRANNIVHAIIAHIMTLLCVAAIYVLLGAEFIAGAQIIVYGGAVTIMLLFAITLTGVARGGARVLDYPKVAPALLGAALFFVLIYYCITETHWVARLQKIAFSPQAVGKVLFKYYVLPFEIISVILLAALVGVVVLARKEERK